MGSAGQMQPALHCEILVLKERKYASQFARGRKFAAGV